MSMVTKEVALSDIRAHINKVGGGYDQWYAGVAADPKKRLFNDHAVEHNWIWRECPDSEDARWVEEKLFNLGCKGDTGGGDYDTKFVYAYKITNGTRE